MHRIDGPGATVDQKFTEGDPVTATPATTVTDDWLNAVQEEIAGVIESAGITLSKGANGQLLAAITSKISAAIPANVPQGVRGTFSRLRLSATGTNALVSVTADELTVSSTSAVYRTLQAVSVSINSAVAGANGLDAGTLSASTWYSVWVIWNGTTVAGLLSLSDTAPTLPAGYTHKARVGWIRTDASANKYPLSFSQVGRQVRYVVAVGSNVASLPTMAGGVLGSPTTPTWSAVSVDSFIPPTASLIDFFAWSMAAGAFYMVADTNAYGAYNSTANPPPIMSGASASASAVDFWRSMSRLAVGASRNIYCAANVADFNIRCLGWEDNL